ncbi:MAG: YfiR family protein [Rhodoferax sp.]|nr:YfiR family protein [Rhodoferax sp.]
MSRRKQGLCGALLAGLLALAPGVRAEELPEYRLKAAFVYNFMVFAEWPAATGNTLVVCILGSDPFGGEIDGLQGKVAAGRSIALQRKAAGESVKDCNVVFVAPSASDRLPTLLESLRGRPVLTIADSSGAMRRGVMLNMNVVQGKVTFEANLAAARNAGLNLSSKLLRLATDVAQ